MNKHTKKLLNRTTTTQLKSIHNKARRSTLCQHDSMKRFEFTVHSSPDRFHKSTSILSWNLFILPIHMNE